MGKKSPDRLAFEALQMALEEVARIGADAPPSVTRRVRLGLADHLRAAEGARAAIDPITMPLTSFDPSDPKVVGRMVALALLAQARVPLKTIRPSYGSGVYAIYYGGEHPLYRGITGTETPIYVGKADPLSSDANSAREQGPRLTGRLLEHLGTIETAERFSHTELPQGLYPIRAEDFTCRRLVCATNAQLVAEKHLIGMFSPLWNSETKACWGMSKHGDAATTRANKRSPWDVVHPGREWALDGRLVDSLSPTEIQRRIDLVLESKPARNDHAALLEEMLEAFRQQDLHPSEPDPSSPLGDEFKGASPDEAGGKDD